MFDFTHGMTSHECVLLFFSSFFTDGWTGGLEANLACLRCRWQGLFAILVLCLLQVLTYYYNKPSKLPL